MLKIAIIGLGVMGRHHYRILKTIPDVEIVALCDPYIHEHFQERFYNDLEEMLLAERIDGAIVAAPTSFHKDIAMKCIAHGTHLLIEKPVTKTVQEGKDLLQLIQNKNTKVTVGHIERFNSAVKTLQEKLTNQEISSISITRVGPFPARISDAGVLADLAVHDIDLIKFITGKKIRHVNIFKSHKITNHYEDNAVLSFLLDGDIIANVTTNWLTPYKKRKIEVATVKAYFDCDLITQEVVEYSSHRENNGSYLVRNHFVRKEEPLLVELLTFINYIKTGVPDRLVTVADAVETLKIIELG